MLPKSSIPAAGAAKELCLQRLDTAALAAMNIGFKSGGGQLYFDDEKNLVGKLTNKKYFI